MNHQFKYDYYRMTGKKWSMKSYFDLMFHYDLRYLKHIKGKRTKVHSLLSLRAARKYGMEILSNEIGEGL